MINRLGSPYLALGLVALLALVVAAACGGEEATPAPQPTATSAPAVATPTRAPAAPTPTPLPVAAPTPTKAPAAAIVKPTGVLTVATWNLIAGSGTPRFCTPTCAENVYLSSAFETLTYVVAGPGGPLDPKDAPMLAESWKVSPDLKTMDFKLRKGVQFHKGYGEMTAQDVAFSYNDANSATTPDSIHGQAGDFAPLITNVEALDPYTARFNFRMFYTAMPLRYMGPFYQTAGIVSKKAFDQLGVEGMRDVYVGTGPFDLLEYRKSERMILEAVNDHWRKVPAVKTVRILDIPEASSRVAMLETGEAQIAGELPYKDVVRLQGKGFKGQLDTGLGWEVAMYFSGNYWEKTHPQTGKALVVNQSYSKPWVGNPDDPASMERARKVRWALAMTIDREGINKSVVEGLGKPSYLNQVSIAQDGWKDKWKIPYDPEKARQLLKEAGYPNGFEMTVWVGPGGIQPEVGDALVGPWQSELKVTTSLERVVYSKYRPGLVQRQTDVPWLTPGDEGKPGFPVHWPKGFQGSALTTGGWGPGFESPFYTEMFFRMNKELDVAKRLAMGEEYFDYVYNEMLQPGIVEAPFIPMYNPKKVLQWTPHPSQNSNLSGINALETVVLAP